MNGRREEAVDHDRSGPVVRRLGRSFEKSYLLVVE